MEVQISPPVEVLTSSGDPYTLSTDPSILVTVGQRQGKERVLGGSWDEPITYSSDHNPTYSLPKRPYIGYPNVGLYAQI